jgi:two-component system, chemotaxis family, sensor kinase CheA
MGPTDDEFLKRLLATFKIEAEEHLKEVSAGLLELENSESTDDNAAILETIYRETHSLKGAARSVNRTDVEDVCQALESVLSALRDHRIKVTSTLLDTLHRTMDTVEKLLADSPGVNIAELIQQLVQLRSGADGSRTRGRGKPGKKAAESPRKLPADEEPSLEKPVAKEPEQVPTAEPIAKEQPAKRPEPDPKTGAANTVRIPVEKLDPILLQMEEMLSVKLTANQRVVEFKEFQAGLDLWRQTWAKASSDLRVLLQSKRGGDNGDNGNPIGSTVEGFKGFIEWNDDHLRDLDERCKSLVATAETDARHLGGMVSELLEDMKNVLMVPGSSLLEAFPRLVRDLSRDLGKEAKLTIKGGELEFDRRILEYIKDTLIHVVRNCVDHGIETPDERRSKGKPPTGSISISISRLVGNQAQITVSDDGAGINLEMIAEEAVKQGMVSPSTKEKMEEQDVLAMIFRSGFSTSDMVTNVSGRGLGMAIVREKVERLGGRILVDTKQDVGTSLRLRLPVTLATFRGILVRDCGRFFVLPASNVDRVVRIRREGHGTVGSKDTIEYGNEVVSLVRLGSALGLPRAKGEGRGSGYLQALVVRGGDKRIAFSVDAVHEEQEVLVKSLGKQLRRVRNISGATILGSGTLVPILNILDLVRSAMGGAVTSGRTSGDRQDKKEVKSLLVAEDSITSRMLLKNILESAGYLVTTAADGEDAWSELRSNHFDMLVSDVEMPKMSGFELTEKVRGDDRLSDLPVVLVTALASREDKERGVDAGADAYIIKSSFEESDLLEVVNRLAGTAGTK